MNTFQRHLDFGGLIEPISTADFIEHYWDRKPLRIQRSDPTFYSGLLPEPDLEFVLRSAFSVPGAVEQISEGDVRCHCDRHEQAIQGFVEGRSLRVNGVQRFSAPVHILAGRIEQFFSFPVNVNLYLTPGGGRKALEKHFDNHDVIVLQVHGRKHWRLFDRPARYPLEFLPLQRHESLEEMRRYRLGMDSDNHEKDQSALVEEFFINPGDLLYLPRGFWHEAETPKDEVSCHLTIGIKSITYVDLLSAILGEIALQSEELRKSLPAGFGSHVDAVDQIKSDVTGLFMKMPKSLPIEMALNQFISAASRNRDSSLANDLFAQRRVRNIAEITLSDRLSVPPGSFCSLIKTRDSVVLQSSGKAYQLDSRFATACRSMLQGQVFTAAELGGNLSEVERVELVTQLVSEGMLVKVG